jgi:hypothetical protein
MSTAMHTPGPWAYAYTRIGHTVRQSPDAHRALLVVNVSDNPEADGRLMAAAPELLAALKAALRVINNECDPDEYAKPLATIHAAIAKATGGAA